MNIAVSTISLEPRWLYIDFNSYFASVEQQLNPALRGRPVAVVPVETDATCAIAASYEAKAFGIKTGTPIWEAKQKCPDLICVLARHEHYVEFHERIVKEVNNHIPVSAVCSIDEVACELMRNEAEPERLKKIALSIKCGLARNIGEVVKCSIGVAPNRYLAKIATDMQKPDGFTILTGADLPRRLYELTLRDLPGIGRNNEKRLHMAGIYDMRTLLALPAKRLRGVWGNVWGERVYYLLRGADLPEEETHRSSVGHSHVMAPELRAPDKAKFVARRLTLKAASRLRRMGYHAASFHLAARLENNIRLEGGARCFRAADSLTFLHLLDRCWQQLLPQMHGQRIRKISVTLTELSQIDETQDELFPLLPEEEMAARKKSERMSVALDKINQRFGRDSILLGMLPAQGKGFSGTKVAFTRIPEMEEFSE